MSRKFALFALFFIVTLSCGESEDSNKNGGEVLHEDEFYGKSEVSEYEAHDIVKDQAEVDIFDVKKDFVTDFFDTAVDYDTGNGEIEVYDAEKEENLFCKFDGQKCDDGDPCTVGDRCKNGECIGEKYNCDDGRECTDDICDGKGGCFFKLRDNFCLINGFCYKKGEGMKNNWCVKCLPEKNKFGWTLDTFGKCEDDNPCTVNEKCVEGKCVFDELDCDDGNPCTNDYCDPESGCVHEPNFLPCDDGDVCTTYEVCIDGKCIPQGKPLDCDDDNQCTKDYCDKEKGCVHEKLNDVPCDDGDVCTVGDTCVDGVCVSGSEELFCDDGNSCTDDFCHPVAGCYHELKMDNICCQGGISICNDNNICTNDICDPETGGCSYEYNDNPCDDNDACTVSDKCTNGECVGIPLDCDDNNPCTIDSCDKNLGCIHENITGECDDNNLCTSGDHCVNGVCVGEMKVCKDDDPCTDDMCDPETGECVFPYNNAPCDDNNFCTVNDTCKNGVCTGEPNPCDDNDPCTNDLCDEQKGGCYHTKNTGNPCDDGIECTVNDTCINGECVGDKSGCGNCPPQFQNPVLKINSFAIGKNGKPGEGLDVDLNPDTCSPQNNCSDGIDNAMSKFAALANGEIEKGMQKGDIVVLFELQDLNFNGEPFQLNIYGGKIVDEGCDFMNDVCDYLVDKNTMTEDCYPIVFFDNAKISGNEFTAGGKNYTFPFDLPLFGTVVTVTLYFARIEGTIVKKGNAVSELDGILCGALNKQELINVIDLIPPDELPVDKELIKTILNSVIETDIDTDGDGTLDGSSMGLKFHAIQGNIVGVKN